MTCTSLPRSTRPKVWKGWPEWVDPRSIFTMRTGEGGHGAVIVSNRLKFKRLSTVFCGESSPMRRKKNRSLSEASNGEHNEIFENKLRNNFTALLLLAFAFFLERFSAPSSYRAPQAHLSSPCWRTDVSAWEMEEGNGQEPSCVFFHLHCFKAILQKKPLCDEHTHSPVVLVMAPSSTNPLRHYWSLIGACVWEEATHIPNNSALIHTRPNIFVFPPTIGRPWRCNEILWTQINQQPLKSATSWKIQLNILYSGTPSSSLCFTQFRMTFDSYPLQLMFLSS